MNQSQNPTTRAELRVMSFNLRTAAMDDGQNHWELRREFALERIRAFQPDLLGLQECQARLQKPDLVAGLPEYTFLGVERGGAGEPGREISAVMLRSAAFEVLSERAFWLSETPDVPASLNWKAVFPRTVEVVHLRRRADGRELAFVNTHFDYIPSAVLGSSRVLRRELEALPADLPLVLCGDFNAGKRSSAYHHLLGTASESGPASASRRGARTRFGIPQESAESGQRFLRDALREAGVPAGPKGEGSFHAFGKLPLPQAIDWILISAHWTVKAAGLDRSSRPPLYPSDHMPIWAILE